MENASKALIIAGAILLSIAIIGIGMSVFNQASDVATKSNMEGQVLEQFNAQFESYEGSVKGANIKSLYSKVIANNQANSDDDTKQVGINNDKDENNLATARKGIKSSSTYDVTIEYKGGQVINIMVDGDGVTKASALSRGGDGDED